MRHQVTNQISFGSTSLRLHMNSCFFLGHRDTTAELRTALDAAIERHIAELGVTDFYVGQYGAFDRMAQSALTRAKAQFPEIRAYLLLPYHPTERPVEISEGFDGTFYPPGMETVPRRLAIARANRYMLSICDHLIAYVWHTASNSRDLLEYAERRGVIIENLAKHRNP